MKKKFVFFDFDGVIVDSFSLALEINRKTIPDLTLEEYSRKFETNINVSMAKYNNSTNREKEYFKEYGSCLNTRKLIPGIKEVIFTLAEKYSLIIVSSTTTEIIKKYLSCHGMEKSFLDVLGNDVDYSKAHKFRIIFDKYNIHPEDCVFITDTLGDIREANEVNLPTIAVTGGFHDEATLKKGKPLAITHDSKTLLKKVESVLTNI